VFTCFGAGCGVSYVLAKHLDSRQKPPSAFVLFIGTSLTVTSLKVLVRILKEKALIYTNCGIIALGVAVITDTISWCLLVMAISAAKSNNMAAAGFMSLEVLAFVLFLVFVFKRYFKQFVEYIEEKRSDLLNKKLFLLTVLLLISCGWITDLLGVHVLFGGFLFGLCIPMKSGLYRKFSSPTEDSFVEMILLPMYFTVSGLKADMRNFFNWEIFIMYLLVLVIATLSKLISCGFAAYISGVSLRESVAIGCLLNVRGVSELLILNIGEELGVIDEQVYTVMILVTISCTLAVYPLVDFYYPPSKRHTASPSHLPLPTVDPNIDAISDAPVASIQGTLGDTAIDVGSEMKEFNSAINDFGIYSATSSNKAIVSYSNFTTVCCYGNCILDVMDIVYTFAPVKYEQHLSLSNLTDFNLSIIKCNEPTMTMRDKLLYLNEYGYAVEVTQESNDIDDYMMRMKMLDSSMPPSEFMPLTLFCRALGICMSNYNMMGDPRAFAYHIQKLSMSNSSKFILFPWEPTAFWKNLFWSTLHNISIPVAVYVTIDDPDFNDQTTSEGSYMDHSGKGFNFSQHTNQIFTVGVVLGDASADEICTQMSLILTHKPMINVYVMYSSNYLEIYRYEAQRNIIMLTELATDKVNLHLISVDFDCDANDYKVLVDTCFMQKFDLIICSYLEDSGPTYPNQAVSHDAGIMDDRSNRIRQESFTGLFHDVFSHTSTVSRVVVGGKNDVISVREFGAIGNMLYMSKSTRKLLIVHSAASLAH
jgi:Kef-type K+ transport system membrane component KefB